MTAPHEPITEEQTDRLAQLLAEVPGGQAMNLETLDGYLVALICSPTLVSMNLYLPPVFGARSMDELEFGSEGELNEVLGLVMQLWNTIAAALSKSLHDKEQFYWPILLEGQDGVARGNDWARGFLRGTSFDKHAWVALLDDEQQGGAILPMFALAHEDDPDPEVRSGPYEADKRDEVIEHMIVGLVRAYKYFEPQRRQLSREMQRGPQTVTRESPKIGRNDRCPCGSGRKYKQCHGAQ
jgi:uncharacterized protein